MKFLKPFLVGLVLSLLLFFIILKFLTSINLGFLDFLLVLLAPFIIFSLVPLLSGIVIGLNRQFGKPQKTKSGLVLISILVLIFLGLVVYFYKIIH